MINPQIAQKLMADITEMKEFVVFLREEALKLNNLYDIKLDDPVELSVEVKARKKAYDKIVDILNPLLNTQETYSNNSKDYIV